MYLARVREEWSRLSNLLFKIDQLALGEQAGINPEIYNKYSDDALNQNDDEESEENKAAYAFMHSIEMTKLLPPDRQEKAIDAIMKKFRKQNGDSVGD
ncbi:MAG: hypothetical protein ACPGLY_27440 [Rubripirellula sp.]